MFRVDLRELWAGCHSHAAWGQNSGTRAVWTLDESVIDKKTLVQINHVQILVKHILAFQKWI